MSLAGLPGWFCRRPFRWFFGWLLRWLLGGLGRWLDYSCSRGRLRFRDGLGGPLAGLRDRCGLGALRHRCGLWLLWRRRRRWGWCGLWWYPFGIGDRDGLALGNGPSLSLAGLNGDDRLCCDGRLLVRGLGLRSLLVRWFQAKLAMQEAERIRWGQGAAIRSDWGRSWSWSWNGVWRRSRGRSVSQLSLRVLVSFCAIIGPSPRR